MANQFSAAIQFRSVAAVALVKGDGHIAGLRLEEDVDTTDWTWRLRIRKHGDIATKEVAFGKCTTEKKARAAIRRAYRGWLAQWQGNPL